MSNVFERIQADLDANDAVLYMKGTPDEPRCGFSGAAAKTLTKLGLSYKAIDILEDPELRQGIKDFANWPTIPQLYLKGQFIGGWDIINEMRKSGELVALLDEKGIAHA